MTTHPTHDPPPHAADEVWLFVGLEVKAEKFAAYAQAMRDEAFAHMATGLRGAGANRMLGWYGTADNPRERDRGVGQGFRLYRGMGVRGGP